MAVRAAETQIGRLLVRKVATAASAQESARMDVQDALDDEAEDEWLIKQPAGQLEIPPRMSVPAAAAAPRPRQPKLVTISTGSEQVTLQIDGTERANTLDSNLKELLAQQAKLPPGSVCAFQLLLPAATLRRQQRACPSC